ncbi:lamin tail domain-containing protein [Myxococcota bacterium]
MRAIAICALGVICLAGCIGADEEECSWGVVCPSDLICHEQSQTCADPTHVGACDGRDDYATCMYPGAPADTVCRLGICVVPRCGDGIVDPGEACDDGNYVDGDGCASDCGVLDTCGNGTINDGEECDGTDLGGESCQSQSYYGGTLSCTATCLFNVSGCNLCGNGAIEDGEECDGTDLEGESCETQGFYSGVLGCAADCSGYDYTGCADYCGDGVAQPDMGEECDGTDLMGASCQSQGFYNGVLACNPNCIAFDTSGCSGYCGDGALNGPEVCDASDFNGADCISLGHVGGALGCGPACDSIDETGCHDGSLIFSEYVEGSSSNKALEVYNTSTTPVDLSVCEILSYNNGASSPGAAYSFPAGSLPSGSTFVVCNTMSGPALAAYCDDLNANPTNFNGDDARELRCGGVLVDSIGRVGEDPGVEWGSAPTTTLDHTLRRLPSITTGDEDSSDPYDPALEWTSYPMDTYDGLGWH